MFAVEVSSQHLATGNYSARCAAGHVWTIDGLTLAAQSMARPYREALFHRLPCAECALIASAARISAFEDPDRLRIEGTSE